MLCRLIKMNRFCLTIFLLILPSLQGCLQAENESDTTIRLATTTSLRDSGLLDELLPDFSQISNIEIDVIAVGSGAAMSLAENNDVDVLIVHDPIREFEFIENGFAENRTTFAWNYFVLLGPENYAGSFLETLNYCYFPLAIRCLERKNIEKKRRWPLSCRTASWRMMGHWISSWRSHLSPQGNTSTLDLQKPRIFCSNPMDITRI